MTIKQIKENMSNEERITLLEQAMYEQHMIIRRLLTGIVDISIVSGMVELKQKEPVTDQEGASLDSSSSAPLSSGETSHNPSASSEEKQTEALNETPSASLS